MIRQRLDVAHTIKFYHCDLRCPYCISDWDNQRGTRSARPVDAPRDLQGAILRAIAALPYRVHLTLSNMGEPFVNRWLLSELTALCNGSTDPGLDALTLITNLHADWDRVIAPFLDRVDTSRLALACTLHDSVLSPAEIEAFFASARRARERGALVMVINVVRPGALDAARHWKARCDREGLPFLPNAIVASEGGRGVRAQRESPYTPDEIAAARDLSETPHSFKLLFEAASTLGEPCAAGRRYVFVDSDGDVFPCLSLKDARPPLGNVLRGTFAASPASGVCPLESCGCPNEIGALHIVDDRYERTLDHRYLIPKAGWAAERLEDGYRAGLYARRAAMRALSATLAASAGRQ
jgi:MoaA/NifB/PqqE/SkfB family radical SAM enzyme